MTFEITTKTCGKCKVEKSVMEFYKCKSNSSGLQNNCKNCSCEISRVRYQNDPESGAARSRAYRQANPGKSASNSKAYYLANFEAIAAHSRANYTANPQKFAARMLSYRLGSPEKYAEIKARTWKRAKEILSDSYIKTLLNSREKIPNALIPQSLVDLKRAQIQISNYLKEQAK